MNIQFDIGLAQWHNMVLSTELAGLDFQPDPTAAEPIYVQLAAALSDSIRAGRIPVGARLPSERLYAKVLGISRTTVTSAYQELKAMGLMRGYVGRGAMVIAHDPDRPPAGAIPWPQRASRPARLSPSTSNAISAGLISLADGWLYPTLVPHAALAACAARAVQDLVVLTKAAPLLGLPALQEALIETLRTNGVKTTPSEVLITGGAQ